MERSNQDRMLSEAELENVTGGHAISASLERFVSGQQGASVLTALSAVSASMNRHP